MHKTGEEESAGRVEQMKKSVRGDLQQKDSSKSERISKMVGLVWYDFEDGGVENVKILTRSIILSGLEIIITITITETKNKNVLEKHSFLSFLDRR